MDLEQYFKQDDTPAEHSPVGEMMVRILAKYPALAPEELRTEANAMLDKAANAKRYVLPRVYSTEQKAANAARLKAAFQKVAA